MSRVETPVQQIALRRLNPEGLILDIGGGGEGLVSRIEGERVCALDIRMSEVREAQIHGAPANWIVGDGQNLGFSSGSFDEVTLWFSLGYMRDWETKRKVLEEAWRVLKSQGTISIMATKITDSTEQFVFWAHFTFPDGTVSKTGYGVRGNQKQTLESVIDLLEKLEFKIVSTEDHEVWFSIIAKRS
ncbi:MAG: class I SAM-dependent methyltransferase [Candidatus Thorarchaeota archaeon]|jgi:ubiquinone/menaquinone biosynthesis C-methylase UbiE